MTEIESEKHLTAFVTLVVGVASGFTDALAVTKLWAWFVTPLGVSAIRYGQAYGLVLLAGVLTMQYVPTKDEDVLKIAASNLVRGLGALAIGAVVYACR